MDEFYRRNCEKNIWWRIFCIWTSFFWKMRINFIFLTFLTPNVNYSGRTAPLTSKVAFYIFIQQI